MRLYWSRVGGVEAGRREVRQQVRDAHLHQVDAGGLQRLEEAEARPIETTFLFHACLRRPV
jgi:hypothetical protein